MGDIGFHEKIPFSFYRMYDTVHVFNNHVDIQQKHDLCIKKLIYCVTTFNINVVDKEIILEEKSSISHLV